MERKKKTKKQKKQTNKKSKHSKNKKTLTTRCSLVYLRIFKKKKNTSKHRVDKSEYKKEWILKKKSAENWKYEE